MGGSFLVKKQAREFLKGNWGVLIASFIVIFVPFLLADVIETFILFFGMEDGSVRSFKAVLETAPVNAAICLAIEIVKLILIVLFLPLVTGITKAAASAARGERVRCSDIFFYFSRGKYFDALCFNLAVFVRVLLTAVLFVLPAVICAVVPLIAGEGNSALYAVMIVLSVALAVLGVAATLVVTSKYFLAQFLYISSDGSEGHFDIIRKSIAYMRGNRDKYILLWLSFIPWVLLCFFFLPLLYVFPYMAVSFANSAGWIIKMNEDNQTEEAAHNGEAFGGTPGCAQNAPAGE